MRRMTEEAAEGQTQTQATAEEKAPAPAKKQRTAQDHAQKYWAGLVGKRVKITPMVAGLPPITGVLKSYGVYEVEVELQNRTVYVLKHAIYTVEEAPEPVIGVKKR